MSITVLPDVVFRHAVISGALRGRQIRKNQRVMTANGVESINIVWDKTLREYDIATIPLQRADWEYIESVHEITEAGAFGFLLEDPKDFSTETTSTITQTSGKVAALGGGQYQLFKRITNASSGRYKDRKITRPNATGFSLYVSNVLQTSGYTLDPLTGIVTIAAAPSATVVKWVGRFYTPVHFMNDIIEWTLDAPGPEEVRYYSGPTVVLQEIWE